MKQKNEKLENALQCADRNRAEKQGDSHHHPSLGLPSCVVVKNQTKQGKISLFRQGREKACVLFGDD
jgi:hypothetical protein